MVYFHYLDIYLDLGFSFFLLKKLSGKKEETRINYKTSIFLFPLNYSLPLLHQDLIQLIQRSIPNYFAALFANESRGEAFLVSPRGRGSTPLRRFNLGQRFSLAVRSWCLRVLVDSLFCRLLSRRRGSMVVMMISTVWGIPMNRWKVVVKIQIRDGFDPRK